jgi:Actinobacteria/chloroflexi VLRF1 release factor
VLEPWHEQVEFVALGGDRQATSEVLEASPQLTWLPERALERFFTVPDPRRRVLDQLPYDLYAAEVNSE